MIVLGIVFLWFVVLAGVLAVIQATKNAYQLKHLMINYMAQAEQAKADRAFVLWATYTMLTVTDTKGYVHAATLRQLHSTGRWDMVWDAPVAVALWHGDPDTIDRYQNEARRDNQFQYAADSENDCG